MLVVQAHQCVEAIDIIHQSPKSAVWKPFDHQENLVIVAADSPATQWVRYNGHFGESLGKPAFTHATEVWGAPFGIGRRAIVKTIAAGAAKMREFGIGAPTLALGARQYIQRSNTADWKHIHVYAAQDVVSACHSAHVPHQMHLLQLCTWYLQLVLQTNPLQLCLQLSIQPYLLCAGWGTTSSCFRSLHCQ